MAQTVLTAVACRHEELDKNDDVGDTKEDGLVNNIYFIKTFLDLTDNMLVRVDLDI